MRVQIVGRTFLVKKWDESYDAIVYLIGKVPEEGLSIHPEDINTKVLDGLATRIRYNVVVVAMADLTHWYRTSTFYPFDILLGIEKGEFSASWYSFELSGIRRFPTSLNYFTDFDTYVSQWFEPTPLPEPKPLVTPWTIEVVWVIRDGVADPTATTRLSHLIKQQRGNISCWTQIYGEIYEEHFNIYSRKFIGSSVGYYSKEEEDVMDFLSDEEFRQCFERLRTQVGLSIGRRISVVELRDIIQKYTDRRYLDIAHEPLDRQLGYIEDVTGYNDAGAILIWQGSVLMGSITMRTQYQTNILEFIGITKTVFGNLLTILGYKTPSVADILLRKLEDIGRALKYSALTVFPLPQMVPPLLRAGFREDGGWYTKLL